MCVCVCVRARARACACVRACVRAGGWVGGWVPATEVSSTGCCSELYSRARQHQLQPVNSVTDVAIVGESR